MTIYFNPRYDSSVFLTAADCGLGKAYYGKEALMRELELRAGLTCAETEHAYRVIEYMEAMQATLDKAGGELFYADSFKQDDFGTAELMLGWRDALVKANWNGKPVADSEKIRVLSLIEENFDCTGSADRWRAIFAEAAQRPILRPTDRIMVQCSKDDLEPSLQCLFDSINAHYAVPIVEYQKACAVAEVIGKCKIIEFDNEYTAHEWIASQDLGQDDVVAEADEALLGDILHILGKPEIGAADEGIGAVMRLLPLGLALFRYPADINSLQSYLQSPRTPLGKLHCQKEMHDGTPYICWTVRLLLDHICSEGGFGDKWTEIIEKSNLDKEGAPLSDCDYKDALEFIGMWEKSKGLHVGEAYTADVTKFVRMLNTWAGKSIQPDGELNAQFQALQSNCKAILRLLADYSGTTIPVEKLCKWANHICVPINISSDYARLGSINVVGNVADIYSGASRLVWYAATTDNSTSYEYEFLSRSEIKALNEAGALLADKEQVARLDKAYKLGGLCRCADVTIVICKRISGVETVKSALLSEISVIKESTPGTPIAKTATANVETDFGKKATHKIDPKIVEDFKREKESYSSINTLIQRPVDYLLDYVKGYKEYGLEGVADVSTVEGNVAHAYIEELGKRCDNNPKEMLEMHRKDYNNLLAQVISEKGLILYLEENILEKNNFKASLKESVEILLGIIIENGLTIEGFEYNLTSDIANIGKVCAKIDCLLRDLADGKYVIIDFKNSSSKTYHRKIEENRELQLAVYRKLVEKELGEVKFIGYFAIPRKTLYTPENTLNVNSAIEEVEKKESMDIFEMAAKGYVFRWSQLRQGILEEGEGLPLAEISYTLQSDLYPLEYVESDDKKEKLKATAYGNKNIVLKGGLK